MGAGARRSADWLKIKTARRQEAVIVGFTAPRRSRPYFGALVLAVRDGHGWRYVGHVGTGFSYSALNELCGSRPRGAFRSIGAQSTDTEGLPVNFLTVFCA